MATIATPPTLLDSERGRQRALICTTLLLPLDIVDLGRRRTFVKELLAVGVRGVDVSTGACTQLGVRRAKAHLQLVECSGVIRGDDALDCFVGRVLDPASERLCGREGVWCHVM